MTCLGNHKHAREGLLGRRRRADMSTSWLNERCMPFAMTDRAAGYADHSFAGALFVLPQKIIAWTCLFQDTLFHLYYYIIAFYMRCILRLVYWPWLSPHLLVYGMSSGLGHPDYDHWVMLILFFFFFYVFYWPCFPTWCDYNVVVFDHITCNNCSSIILCQTSL